MNQKKNISQDTIIHSYIFLRVGLLAILFIIATACWSFGDLLILPAIIIYWIYCSLYNTWGWAGIGHEFIHNSPFRQKIWNKIYLWITSLLTLSNKNLFLLTHFSHHKTPHTSDDFENPYTNKRTNHNYDLINILNKLIDVRKLFNFLRYLIYNLIGIIPVPKLSSFVKSKGRFDIVILNARIIFIWVSFIIIVSVFLNSALLLFALLIPNFVGTGLVKSLASLQHPNSDLINALDITKIEFNGDLYPVTNFNDEFFRDNLDMLLPFWISFFYANMNYHATHHIHMSIPFYSLSKESEINVRRGRVGLICLKTPHILKLFLQSH